MSNDFVTKRTTLPSPEKLFTEMFETGDPDHTQPSMLTDIHHDSPVLHKKDLKEQEEQMEASKWFFGWCYFLMFSKFFSFIPNHVNVLQPNCIVSFKK